MITRTTRSAVAAADTVAVVGENIFIYERLYNSTIIPKAIAIVFGMIIIIFH